MLQHSWTRSREDPTYPRSHRRSRQRDEVYHPLYKPLLRALSMPLFTVFCDPKEHGICCRETRFILLYWPHTSHLLPPIRNIACFLSVRRSWNLASFSSTTMSSSDIRSLLQDCQSSPHPSLMTLPPEILMQIGNDLEQIKDVFNLSETHGFWRATRTYFIQGLAMRAASGHERRMKRRNENRSLGNLASSPLRLPDQFPRPFLYQLIRDERTTRRDLEATLQVFPLIPGVVYQDQKPGTPWFSPRLLPPLHLAAWMGKTNLVEVLQAQPGFDKNMIFVPPPNIGSCSVNKEPHIVCKIYPRNPATMCDNALDWAIAEYNEHTAQIARLDWESSGDEQTAGRTKRKQAIVRAMIKSGVSCWRTDENGVQHPVTLYKACKYGTLSTFNIILDATLPKLRPEHKKKVLEYAFMWKRADILHAMLDGKNYTCHSFPDTENDLFHTSWLSKMLGDYGLALPEDDVDISQSLRPVYDEFRCWMSRINELPAQSWLRSMGGYSSTEGKTAKA
ncbi:hypothetical protein F4780DRAFT_740167 [Xylariomycetidae sp. FL0641]|nr:hypothetical protein F4780DRAFT_740167 [Xylariomycetidae sp. FL0641]